MGERGEKIRRTFVRVGLLVFIVFVLLFRTYDAREMLAMKQ